MARKKEEPKAMTETEPKPETKPVRLDLSLRGHRLLRLIAAHEDKSMAIFAKETLETILEQRIKDLGIKV